MKILRTLLNVGSMIDCIDNDVKESIIISLENTEVLYIEIVISMLK